MEISLANKNALVTGGSKGIGAAICRLFAEAGANVAFTYFRSTRETERLRTDIQKQGTKALAIRANIQRGSEIGKAVGIAKKAFGTIDILVNNAGIWKRAEIGAMTEQDFDETIDTNLKSAFLFTAAVVPLMKRRKSGRIINIASTAGQRGEAFYSHYAASKAGIIALTKSIAVELSPFNIFCNCVAPGWVDTDMTANPLRIPKELRNIIRTIPNGRVATSEDVAKSVLFLASDLSSHIIGATVSVNGGSVLV
ncbi:MAG: 3-oxoacyl-ACP reductase FabG [Ignavibacteriales bacterium]|nr:3-oxoacyl-ACP reductase FabG [Ignavibacteriales bacterium]